MHSSITDEFAPAPRKARIEIIPLIDVIFFLLATFVLFTLSLEKIRGIEVPLPKGGEKRADSALQIQASGDGTLYWREGSDGAVESISVAELRPRLADYVGRVSRPRVLVRGDGSVRFGPAIMVLDEVRLAKIREVSIETKVSRTGD